MKAVSEISEVGCAEFSFFKLLGGGGGGGGQ